MKPLITGYSSIRGDRIVVNDRVDHMPREGRTIEEHLAVLYRAYGITYPKFFKMDGLCRLALLTAELMLRNCDLARRYANDVGVVLGNGSSSIVVDRLYADTFTDDTAYFPSPALFVYTLPNVMVGELCIRFSFMGENALLISHEFDPGLLAAYITSAFHIQSMDCCITGWVEFSEERAESTLYLIEQDTNPVGSMILPFNADNLRSLHDKINSMEPLIEELKREIVKRLRLQDVDWRQIDTDAPIFVEGLGLDSIDALELMVLLDQVYGLKVVSSEEGKKILYSVRTMAEYITANRQR